MALNHDKYLSNQKMMKTIKRLYLLFGCFCLIFLNGCADNIDIETTLGACTFKMTMVTDELGIENPSNALFWDSLKQLTVKHNMVLDCVSFVVAESNKTYQQTLNTATFKDDDLLIITNKSMESALLEVAASNPQQKYLYLGKKINRANVINLDFSPQDKAFLAGLSAALFAKDQQKTIFGFVSNQESSDEFKAYKKAIQLILPTASVISYNTTGFIKTADYVPLLKQLYQDMGVVFYCNSDSDFKMILTDMLSHNKNNENCWLINNGYDAYQAGLMTDGKSLVVASVFDRFDTVLTMVVQMLSDGTFRGGSMNVLELSIINSGVDIFKDGKRNLSEINLVIIEEFINRIKIADLSTID